MMSIGCGPDCPDCIKLREYVRTLTAEVERLRRCIEAMRAGAQATVRSAEALVGEKPNDKLRHSPSEGER
jgi:hypothetical protein